MPAQASAVSQEICPLAAVLVTVEAHDEVPLQVTVHSLPAQTMGPAHELPCPQEIVQVLALEQSTPPAQAEAPQVTSHG